jgi:hypothetical protein
MKNLILSILIVFLSTLSIQAQDKESKTEKINPEQTIMFKIKDVQFTPDSIAQPKIYIDGKLFDFDISLIDQDQIESMNVIKGEEAKRLYDAPQGVILITTKLNSVKSDVYRLKADKTEFRFRDSKGKDDISPLFFIDGKQVDQKAIKALSPDDIESIEVLKDKAAEKLYNAENGVIIIKTKKGEK